MFGTACTFSGSFPARRRCRRRMQKRNISCPPMQYNSIFLSGPSPMFTLILPGFLRRSDENPVLPATPALNRLIRFGRFQADPLGSAELYQHYLCDTVPLAGNQIYASPMWQQTGMNSIIQLDGSAIAIRPEEAQALCSGLNGFYGGELDFQPLRPDLWRLTLPQPPQWHAPPLWDVCGQIDGFTRAEGSQHRQWLQLTTEIQMWLHAEAATHPARQPPVNSIWLWRPQTAELKHHPALLGSNSPWAAQSSLNVRPAPADFAEWLARCAIEHHPADDTALFAEDFTASRHTGDIWAYRDQLAHWERHFFAPIWQALAQGRLHGFRLLCDGEHGGTLTVTPAARHAFWKRKKTFNGQQLD